MKNAQQIMMVFAGLAGYAFGQQETTFSSTNEGSVPVVERSAADAGWRVSGGLDYRFRYKTDLKMNTARYDAAHPAFTPPRNAYPSRSEVLGQIGNGTIDDQRRDYDDGYVASDSAGGGSTWNWAADGMSQYNAVDETVSFSSFYGVTQSSIGSRETNPLSDDMDMAGVKLDIAREIFRSGDFSLSVSLGGSYFPERELLSARQQFAAGTYRSEVWQITDVYDVSAWGGTAPIATVGGGFGGPDAMLPYLPSQRSEGLSQVLANETFEGGAWVESDMWLAEARLCLMPEWQALDRLSLLGNVGVAVEYASISSHSGSWMTQNQTQDFRRSSSSDSEWVVQAIVGLGARFAVTDRIGLSVMGEARLPRTTIDIEADPYEGQLEMGTWSLGTQIDYCF